MKKSLCLSSCLEVRIVNGYLNDDKHHKIELHKDIIKCRVIVHSRSFYSIFEKLRIKHGKPHVLTFVPVKEVIDGKVAFSLSHISHGF